MLLLPGDSSQLEHSLRLELLAHRGIAANRPLQLLGPIDERFFDALKPFDLAYLRHDVLPQRLQVLELGVSDTRVRILAEDFQDSDKQGLAHILVRLYSEEGRPLSVDLGLDVVVFVGQQTHFPRIVLLITLRACGRWRQPAARSDRRFGGSHTTGYRSR